MVNPASTRCRIQSTPNVAYPVKQVTSAANTDAVIDLAHGVVNATLSASLCWVIGINGLLSSYKGSPVDGSIVFSVRDYNSGGGFTDVLSLDYSSAGPAPIPFFVPLKFDPGKDVRLTIKAGGAGVIGKLILLSYWRESVADPAC
jgi:hypothetical protein